MEMDVRPTSARPTCATLDLYCDRVASAVGRLSVRVFGMEPSRARARPSSRPRAAADQYPARSRRGRGDRAALSAARGAARRRHHSTDPATVLANPTLDEACSAIVALAQGDFERADAIMAHARAARCGRRASWARPIASFSTRLTARGFAPPRAPVRLPRAQTSASSCCATACAFRWRAPSTSSAPDSPALRRAQACRRAASTSVVHEATAAGGRCRSYLDAAVGMTIDNGNHLLLSGNRAALAYLRDIGAERSADRPAGGAVSLRRSGDRRALDARFNDGRLPFWMFDPRAPRAGDARARLSGAGAACCGRRPGKTVGEVIACRARSISGWWSRCCWRRSTRSAARARRACRRGGARNARGGRPRLPAADRARRLERDVRRAGACACCSSAAPRCVRHQLRAHPLWRPAGSTALDFGDETIALAPDDAVVLAVPPYAAAALVPRSRGADRVPRHRQRAFPDRAAGRISRRSSAWSAAGANGFSPFPAGSRSPSAPPTGWSTRRARSWPRRSGAMSRAYRVAGRAAAVADRAGAARHLRRHARRRMPSGRARQPRGAIWFSPATGPIPACRPPSKAPCGPATAPPISLARPP